MLLSELVSCVDPVDIRGELQLEIRGLHYDSRTVKPGGLFFALKGEKSDGLAYVDAAVGKGAVAVVADRPCAVAGATVITVSDARRAMSLMASRFCGDPTAAIPVVGITGTNGKTTTTYLVEGILACAGIPAAVLGTISYRLGTRAFPAPNTTPESVDLQETLRTLVGMGASGVVMEVSSHSLEQRRVDGCLFDVAVFSNLTRDHLDYHGSMESYFQSKLRFFTELIAADRKKPGRKAVVNLDDPYGPQIAAASAAPVIGYGMSSGEINVESVDFTVDGIRCTLNTPAGTISLKSDLLGRFNLYNIMAAVGAGLALEIPPETIRCGIESHRKVPGRVERVDNNKGITVLVDYAHTGDALENVLNMVNELKTGRIITVFGCGGDRDKGKRPVMGEIAARMSDLAVVTSDNPRTEEPHSIIEDIRRGIEPLGLHEFGKDEVAAGFTGKGFVAIDDRREAIRTAIQAARPGDIVLLAGKGHEDYQILGTQKHHFDDREEAAAALELVPKR